MSIIRWGVRLLVAVVGIALLAGLFCFLEWYIAPEDVTQRNDLIRTFALIVGGIVAFGTLFVGWQNLLHNQRALAVQQQSSQQALQQARELEDQRAKEAALQKYIGQMGKLIADPERPLRRSTIGDNLSAVARAHTNSMLQGLDDPARKRILLQFLYQSGLIHKDKPVVDLTYADLNDANLQKAYLEGVSLKEAFLMDADLRGAFLVGSDLSESYLARAKLDGTFLGGVDLTGVHELTQEQIDVATGDNKAVIPDYLKRPEAWSAPGEEGSKSANH